MRGERNILLVWGGKCVFGEGSVVLGEGNVSGGKVALG